MTQDRQEQPLESSTTASLGKFCVLNDPEIFDVDTVSARGPRSKYWRWIWNIRPAARRTAVVTIPFGRRTLDRDCSTMQSLFHKETCKSEIV